MGSDEGVVDLKSRSGRRRVPIAAVLRDFLTEHRIASGRSSSEFTFGRTESSPFRPASVQDRADKAWLKVGLERLTFHDCRHTAANLMIGAGVNAKALSRFMGHANIRITFDTYGHLMPGSEEEAAGLIDAYLAAQREQAAERARTAGGRLTGELSGKQMANESREPLV